MTQKMVTAALLAALVCVATMLIKIPSPLKGYLNLGDCVVLFAGWMMPPLYGFLAAGIGSALADLFSGYAVYIPATFTIKGLMALTAYGVFKMIRYKMNAGVSWLISGALAELVMVLGYYFFEGCLYGFGAAAVNIPANAAQGAAGVVFGIILIKAFEKNKNVLY